MFLKDFAIDCFDFLANTHNKFFLNLDGLSDDKVVSFDQMNIILCKTSWNF